MSLALEESKRQYEADVARRHNFHGVCARCSACAIACMHAHMRACMQACARSNYGADARAAPQFDGVRAFRPRVRTTMLCLFPWQAVWLAMSL